MTFATAKDGATGVVYFNYNIPHISYFTVRILYNMKSTIYMLTPRMLSFIHVLLIIMRRPVFAVQMLNFGNGCL
jgi:hypothetical protein